MLKAKLHWIRRYFIDCGGHNGSSVRKFRRTFDQSCTFDIFTFEPNPEFSQNYWNFPRHNLIPYAVWTENCAKEFFLDREDGDGSTLIKEKLTRHDGGVGELDKNHPIRVQTIDLSNWIIRNFRKNDLVILKLDIEGAEYEVLNKMINDGAIDYIDKLYIEWHWFKVGISESTHNDIVNRISARGVPITEWDAQIP